MNDLVGLDAQRLLALADVLAGLPKSVDVAKADVLAGQFAWIGGQLDRPSRFNMARLCRRLPGDSGEICCCALGWGAWLHRTTLGGSMEAMSSRLFGIGPSEGTFGWCFGISWSSMSDGDTAKAAALRLYWLIGQGSPYGGSWPQFIRTYKFSDVQVLARTKAGAKGGG